VFAGVSLNNPFPVVRLFFSGIIGVPDIGP
jgi:hypothetical protein